ncbi:MAG TPA: hypothetical protein VFN75_04785 [Pseudonocardiaceae bacterium]|nr:hypothetical protein [Pseudonocardiaceae bacterium]
MNFCPLSADPLSVVVFPTDASYDAERHNDARRLWMIALSVARQADHPRAMDLTAGLLLDMAHQSLHLRRRGKR